MKLAEKAIVNWRGNVCRSKLRTLTSKVLKSKDKRSKADMEQYSKESDPEPEAGKYIRRSTKLPKMEEYCVQARPRRAKSSAEDSGFESGKRCCGRDRPNYTGGRGNSSKAKKATRKAKAQDEANKGKSQEMADSSKCSGAEKCAWKLRLEMAAAEIDLIPENIFRNFTNINEKRKIKKEPKKLFKDIRKVRLQKALKNPLEEARIRNFSNVIQKRKKKNKPQEKVTLLSMRRSMQIG